MSVHEGLSASDSFPPLQVHTRKLAHMQKHTNTCSLCVSLNTTAVLGGCAEDTTAPPLPLYSPLACVRG